MMFHIGQDVMTKYGPGKIFGYDDVSGLYTVSYLTSAGGMMLRKTSVFYPEELQPRQ